LTRDLYVVSGTFTNEKEIKYEADYSVFPNPVRDVLYLKAENSNTVNFEFKNMLGTTLQSGMLNESISIDVSGYQPGVYFVVFQTSDTVPYVVKVLVQ
jgi:hypothetical protein